MVKNRYKPLFSESVYRLVEADDENQNTDEEQNTNTDDGTNTNTGTDQNANTTNNDQSQNAAPTDTSTSTDATQQTAATDTSTTGTPDQSQDQTTGIPETAPTDTDEAQKEEQKQEELAIQGQVSNILSEISDRLSGMTFKFYTAVEKEAIEYFNKDVKMPNETKKELLKQFPEVGLKIISNALKNNFIDKDHVAYMAIIEAYLEIMKGIEYPELSQELAQVEDEL